MVRIVFDPGYGIRLIGREYVGSYYLMHHGVKGQKHGVRQWQNKDGSYTPEGYRHYAEMYGWGKGRATISNSEYKSIIKNANAGDAEFRKKKKKATSASDKVYIKSSEAGREKSRAVLSDATKVSSKNTSNKLDKDQELQELEQMERLELAEKYLKSDKRTNSETRFEGQAYAAGADKKLMRDVEAELNKPQHQQIRDEAEAYVKQSKYFNGDMWQKYEKQWHKDNPGKEWDGDGSEFHEALLKRYPEYKREWEKLTRHITKLVKSCIDLSKDSSMDRMKAFEKYDKYVDKIEGRDGTWYKMGNIKPWVIAQAVTAKNGHFDDLFPEMFIEQFDSKGNILRNPWLEF